MKHLNYWACFLCLLLPLTIHAQYTIIPVPPPPNFTFNDLWHFSVTRANADNYTQFYVSLRIYDGGSQLKVKSNSANLSLPVGNQYYNVSNLADLQPLTTSYYDAATLQQTISSGGMFPAGNYNIVYTLYGKAKDGEFTPLAEEATQAVVEVMWPPLLLWPEDEAVINSIYPSLTWTPAFSSTFMGTITYNLKMVELQPGQSKEQAILSNPSFYSLSSHPSTFYPYGAADPILEAGHVYVWQVTAQMGEVTAQSQVWQFTLGQARALRAAPTGNFFTPVAEALDGSYHVAKDYTLKIKYTEEYELPAAAYLLYNIYNKHGELVATSLPPRNSPSAGIKKGDNYITLSLNSGGLSLKAKEYYILEIMNYKNEKRYLRFFVQN